MKQDPSRPVARRRLGGIGGLRRFFLAGLGLPTGSLVAALALGGCELRELPPRGDAESPADSAATAAAIETMLHASAAEWNAGSLDGFMDDYWRSEGLTFSGSGGVTRGWEAVRERYLRTYFAPGSSRDHLRFEQMEVSPLGPDHALALGRYVLSRPGDSLGATSSGHFSLVLRWVAGGWKIIHDHTSSTPPEGER